MNDYGRANPQRRAGRGLIMRAASATVAVMLLLSGCAQLADVRFTQDHRLRFTEPDEGQVVELPVTVSWTKEDLDIEEVDSAASEDAYFAVVVDKYPPGPGRPLTDLLPRGTCSSDPACPSPDVLASLGDTYVTHGNSVTVPSVALSAYGSDTHFAVVFLVDADGNRIGDSSWTITFTVERAGAAS